MEIFLVRHGKSRAKPTENLSYDDYINWLRKYKDSGIIPGQTIPRETLAKAQTVNLMITSSLKRSYESAMLLNPNANIKSNSLFDEVNLESLPHFNFLNHKLSPITWSMALGMISIFHKHKNHNHFLTETSSRAHQAARHLEHLAKNHKRLMLVGHGIFNLFIGEELIHLGWESKTSQSGDYWNLTSYIKNSKKS